MTIDPYSVTSTTSKLAVIPTVESIILACTILRKPSTCTASSQKIKPKCCHACSNLCQFGWLLMPKWKFSVPQYLTQRCITSLWESGKDAVIADILAPTCTLWNFLHWIANNAQAFFTYHNTIIRGDSLTPNALVNSGPVGRSTRAFYVFPVIPDLTDIVGFTFTKTTRTLLIFFLVGSTVVES